MKNTFEVRVRRNGQITLSSELRKRARFEQGIPLVLYDLGNGVLVLSRARSRTEKILDTLAEKWREAGLSLEDMLATLRQVRTEKH
jgi:bifunctional DNA-binding transcriptional regulator/antitoxin component of YhaV-PrlF toxin-antitoxin module